ncbi:hypothetical protein GCM10017750_33330 [Streptomyces racemochromogenes]
MDPGDERPQRRPVDVLLHQETTTLLVGGAQLYHDAVGGGRGLCQCLPGAFGQKGRAVGQARLDYVGAVGFLTGGGQGVLDVRDEDVVGSPADRQGRGRLQGHGQGPP